MTVRFFNHMAKKYNITPIDYKVKLPLLSEKYHLTEQEFICMINYNTNHSGLRKDHRANLKQSQDILYINSLIGLRINELLKVKKGNIIFNQNYVTIKFLEHKKNDIRQVIITDEKAISIIKYYIENSKTQYLFNLYINVFNNNLKTLARLTGLTEPTEYSKNYRAETITHTKPKYELISSHSIRRYAINRNVVEYGIDVARQYSGHKDYMTIKKNYIRNLTEQELLIKLKPSK